MRIPAAALVVVADGRKALILENQGDEDYPNLQVRMQMEHHGDAPNHEIAADRPGRSFDSTGRHRHAHEATDHHDRAEADFAREVATIVARETKLMPHAKVILVAPPRSIALLRPALAKLAECEVVADLTKDLTRHPVAGIERIVAAA